MDYSGGNSSSGGGGGVYGMFGSAAQHLASSPSTSRSHHDDPSTSSSGGPSASCSAAAFDWDDMTGAGSSSGGSSKALDLVFVMDCTGSMGSYIASATNHIETICDNIKQSEQLSAPGALRVVSHGTPCELPAETRTDVLTTLSDPMRSLAGTRSLPRPPTARLQLCDSLFALYLRSFGHQREVTRALRLWRWRWA